MVAYGGSTVLTVHEVGLMLCIYSKCGWLLNISGVGRSRQIEQWLNNSENKQQWCFPYFEFTFNWKHMCTVFFSLSLLMCVLGIGDGHFIWEGQWATLEYWLTFSKVKLKFILTQALFSFCMVSNGFGSFS